MIRDRLAVREEELLREIQLERRERENQIADVTESLDSELRKAVNSLADAVARGIAQASELERLSERREEAEREIQRLRATITSIEGKHKAEVEQISADFNTFRRRTLELNELEVRIDSERKRNEAQQLLLRQKLSELEKRLANADADTARLKSQLEEKMRENAELRASLSSAEVLKYGECVQLRSQLDAARKANMEQNEELLKLQTEKYQLEVQLRHLKIRDRSSERIPHLPRDRFQPPSLEHSPFLSSRFFSLNFLKIPGEQQ
eukprot:TRINITY_DN8885_c0_g1_i4.p1 TRINITY_DN8885_c0_g1~~TRINITY_DN8885_c0_g1_i4.p1  ORF type:complete len:265 (+),score=61.92 TRINITY_DN8885_c0_g1_i4:267-1061(+)